MNASFRKLCRPMALFIVFQLILIMSATAQNSNRAVRGTVKDNEGNPLKDVHVQAYRVDGGNTRNVKTNDKGEFTIILLQAGTYLIGARKEGFTPSFEDEVRPEIDQAPPEINLVLSPGKDMKFIWEWTEDEKLQYEKKYKKIEKLVKASGRVKEYFNKGVTKYQEGDYPEAIKFLKTAEKYSLKQPQPYVNFNLGLCEYKQDNYEEALKYFNEAIELDATIPDFFTQKAEVLLKLGKTDESLQAFEESAKLSEQEAPNKAALSHTNRCIILGNHAKYDEALEACKQAVAIDPDYPEGHYYLGMALLRKPATICEAKKELILYQELPTDKFDLKQLASQMVEEFKNTKCEDSSDLSSATGN